MAALACHKSASGLSLGTLGASGSTRRFMHHQILATLLVLAITNSILLSLIWSVAYAYSFST